MTDKSQILHTCNNCLYRDMAGESWPCIFCWHLGCVKDGKDYWAPNLFVDHPDSMKKSDPVNHPDHYTCGDIECKEAIRVAISAYTDPVDAWRAGNAMKYIWRAALKGHYLEDIKKAIFYLNEIVNEKENNNV